MDVTEKKMVDNDELSAELESKLELVCMESPEVKDEADQMELIVKFLQTAFSMLGLPLKIMVSGSTREGTRLSKKSDIDIVIIPTHVLVSEDCLEYDANKPCHVRIRADSAPDILKPFRHGETDYISVNALKHFERTEIFPAIVSWDSVRNLLNTPFNIREDSFDLLTETKVGRLFQQVKLDSNVREKLNFDHSKKTLSENFYDDWLQTVLKAFPFEDNQEFNDNFHQLILDPGKLQQALKSDEEHQLSNAFLVISEEILGPLRTWHQKHQNSWKSSSEKMGPYFFLMDFVKGLAAGDQRNSGSDTIPCKRKRLRKTDEVCSSSHFNNDERIQEKHHIAGSKSILTDMSSRVSVCSLQCNRSMDILPMLKCSGKPTFLEDFRKRNRLWPPNSVIDQMVDSGFGLVCKYPTGSQTPDIDFQLALNDAEFLLAQNMCPNQKRCLRLLKFLKNKVLSCLFAPGEHLMTSFHVRTAFYWFSEEKDEQFWQHTSLLECSRRLMDFMFPHFRDGKMSHYFIPLMDVLADIDKSNMDILLNLWNQLYSDPLRDINSTFILPNKMIGTSPTTINNTTFIGDIPIVPKDDVIEDTTETLYYDAEALSPFKDFVDDTHVFKQSTQCADTELGDKMSDFNKVLEGTLEFVKAKTPKPQDDNSNKEMQYLRLLTRRGDQMCSLVNADITERKKTVGDDSSASDTGDGDSKDTSSRDVKYQFSAFFSDLSSIIYGQKQNTPLDTESSAGDTNAHTSTREFQNVLCANKHIGQSGTQDTIGLEASSNSSPHHARGHDTSDMDVDEESSTEAKHPREKDEKMVDDNTVNDVSGGRRGEATSIQNVLSGLTRRGLTLLQDCHKEDFAENMQTFISESMVDVVSSFEENNFFSVFREKCEKAMNNADSKTNMARRRRRMQNLT